MTIPFHHFDKHDNLGPGTSSTGAIANGSSNKQTALELNISQQTVKNHLKHIFSKMEVNDRTSAVLLAMRNGWIKGQLTK